VSNDRETVVAALTVLGRDVDALQWTESAGVRAGGRRIARRRVASVSVAVVLLLGLGTATAWQVAGRLGLAERVGGPPTWQEQLAAIDGVQNYLVSSPGWFRMDPSVGNHRTGRITYPLSPPVGGLHNPMWQDCMGDVYPEQIPAEHAVHSLEHGAVWVTYRPDLPADQVEALARRVRNVEYTLMSPYPGQTSPISVQAWGYQLRVEDAHDLRIDAFIRAARRNATQEPDAACGNGVTVTGTEPLSFG
jgi:hypothetical protein